MWHLLIALICYSFPISAILLASHEFNVPTVLPLTVYCLYTACAAMIFTMIAQRLYAMHGVRRFAFDIAIWFMLAALLALPLGTADVIANWLATVKTQLDARSIQNLRLTLAAFLYLELVPVFFLTEGAVALLAMVVRKIKGRKMI